MATFEVISMDEFKARTAGPTKTTEEWCHWVMKQERFIVPEVKFRYSKPRKERLSPAYAQELLQHVEYQGKIRKEVSKDYCETHQDNDYCEPIEKWYWLKPAQHFSSGRAWGYRIVCTFGTDEHDRKYTFLHELAHCMVGVDHNHDKVFWSKCFDLCEKYGLDMDEVYRRSGNYIKGSKKVAAQRRQRS